MTRIARPLAAIACVGGALAALAGCGASAHATPEIHIQVTHQGFVPAEKSVRRGAPVVLVFTRVVDETCGTDVVFPSLHRGYDLPLNKPVRVELAADEVRDTLFFNCSGEILTGMLVAK
jgi:plastocyanin domain-containing protein